MLMKKIFLVLVFSICFFSVSFAGVRNVENDLWGEDGNKKNSVRRGEIDIDKYYSSAMNAYWLNNMEEAQTYLDEILSIENDSRADELKNKIMLLEEKRAFYVREIVNDYSIIIKRALKDSDFFEGSFFLKKLMAISPDENVAYMSSKLKDDIDNTVQYLYSNEDKEKLRQSVNYFSEGQFSKSDKIISKLCEKYPKFLNFKALCAAYSIEEKNDKAIAKYYKKALNAAQKGDIAKAKNLIDLAYNIRRDDIDVIMLMEKIDMELM